MMRHATKEDGIWMDAKEECWAEIERGGSRLGGTIRRLTRCRERWFPCDVSAKRQPRLLITSAGRNAQTVPISPRTEEMAKRAWSPMRSRGEMSLPQILR